MKYCHDENFFRKAVAHFLIDCLSSANHTGKESKCSGMSYKYNVRENHLSYITILCPLNPKVHCQDNQQCLTECFNMF